MPSYVVLPSAEGVAIGARSSSTSWTGQLVHCLVHPVSIPTGDYLSSPPYTSTVLVLLRPYNTEPRQVGVGLLWGERGLEGQGD